MVLKRQCSFCADEIEPGTGLMFVKRDGTIFHFCSSSCRKQQIHLHRVGHRLKWTRAHELRRVTEQAPTGPAPSVPVPAEKKVAATRQPGTKSARRPGPKAAAARVPPARPKKPSPPASKGTAAKSADAPPARTKLAPTAGGELEISPPEKKEPKKAATKES